MLVGGLGLDVCLSELSKGVGKKIVVVMVVVVWIVYV